MSDKCIPTVTIMLKEYDQLRKDAVPVQDRALLATNLLVDAYHQYTKMFELDLDRAPKSAINKLGLYLRYLQKCVRLGTEPLMFHEGWERP